MTYTLKNLYNLIRCELKELPDEKFEALVLIEHFYGLSQSDIILNPTKELYDCDEILKAVKERKDGRPLQYILGSWHFGNLTLKVSDGVLIPREDSLILVDCATNYIKDAAIVGVDLCSGTGAIALEISHNCKNAVIDAIELYEKAYDILLYNVKNLDAKKVFPKNGDVLSENLASKYYNLDFVVSNPPYIKSSELCALQKEVQNEPMTALDGGADGLYFYKAIIKNWTDCLKKGGLISFEIGDEQAFDVSEILKSYGYKDIHVLKDLAGLDRVVYAIK